jgi:hypothetical protein
MCSSSNDHTSQHILILSSTPSPFKLNQYTTTTDTANITTAAIATDTPNTTVDAATATTTTITTTTAASAYVALDCSLHCQHPFHLWLPILLLLLLLSFLIFQELRLAAQGVLAGITGLLGPAPCIEGGNDGRFLPNFLPESPLDGLQTGKFPNIPLLTGVTKDETASALFGKSIHEQRQQQQQQAVA